MTLQNERRRAERRATALAKDEHELLQVYRKAKALKYADINIAIQEGMRVKLWLTEKLK
jgi:hypothetical protein